MNTDKEMMRALDEAQEALHRAGLVIQQAGFLLNEAASAIRVLAIRSANEDPTCECGSPTCSHAEPAESAEAAEAAEPAA